MAREIPGFYYDEEKGKYFRVQQSHRVTPGTGYTKQSIKAAQQIKGEKERQQHRTKRQNAGKIKRSRLMLHSTSPLLLRLGTTTRHNEVVLKQYSSGLSRYCIGGNNRNPDQGFLGSSFSISRTGILRAWYTSFSTTKYDELPMEYPSISLSNYLGSTPEIAEIITNLYNSNGEEFGVVSTAGSSSFTINPVDAQGHMEYVHVEMDTAVWGVETIWDIAASSSSPRLAIAADSRLIIGHCHENSVPALSLVRCRDLEGKEQMNVSFKDTNIIMSGERSGRINFTDARMGRSVVRLLHSSAVLGTLALPDANQVLAHGYSTTSTYDLRWVQQAPVSIKARSTDSAKHSRAYLRFAVPHNRWSDHYSRGRKVAYSSDLSLVAAASCNTSQLRPLSYVTLYSARTGRVVESPLTRHQYKEAVKCLDIRRVRDGPESVFCFSGNRIDEWAFGEMSYGEGDAYGVPPSSSEPTFKSREHLGLSFEHKWEKT